VVPDDVPPSTGSPQYFAASAPPGSAAIRTALSIQRLALIACPNGSPASVRARLYISVKAKHPDRARKVRLSGRISL
jgi:hypothetical protein